jgi:hypothetical protein
MTDTHYKPFVIGVAGGSGSGKSTVTREVLASIVPDMASVVMQDDDCLDQSHFAPDDRFKTNYDHPDAFDWPLMVQQVQALCRGEPIDIPIQAPRRCDLSAWGQQIGGGHHHHQCHDPDPRSGSQLRVWRRSKRFPNTTLSVTGSPYL